MVKAKLSKAGVEAIKAPEVRSLESGLAAMLAFYVSAAAALSSGLSDHRRGKAQGVAMAQQAALLTALVGNKSQPSRAAPGAAAAGAGAPAPPPRAAPQQRKGNIGGFDRTGYMPGYAPSALVKECNEAKPTQLCLGHNWAGCTRKGCTHLHELAASSPHYTSPKTE